ncbi:acyl-CoA dehydrogenase [Ferrimicrobium acidiphilum DSM 19497]|uniref:Acyl-CoA dehydrogenase n=1 Tax=Ferrimicrobium acidiphilum DSM 19497 TaxID=1121877 RepID=A0A0D8FS98_9ACTN|nr:acyl-CoA dehydrogenase family protein [Ferrimicrobium acidiphilum]KJE76006.1 acyl-CoA dehydrogenase [Ferrimicrobium acidiphilum DSM 19497]
MPRILETPESLFDIDGLLYDEEREMRDVVRSYVTKHIKPEVATWFEQGHIPAKELSLALGKLGVLGMHLEGYGCAGTTAVAYGLACLELEAGDSGIRSLVSVQGSLAMKAIHAFGSEEQKQEWLPHMASGEKIGCFGLTEPDFGSDPSGMRTHAKRDGSDWVLNGTKMWITNGNVADVAVIWAQTDEGIRGFIVPTDTAGFSANLIHHKLSLRASVTSELVLDGIRLPADAVLPNVSSLRGPLTCLNEARFGIIFGALGAARECLETAIQYGRERIQFDRPIAGYQLTQKKYVDMAVELGKGILLALHLARLKDQGTLNPVQVNIGKLNSAREALSIARECRNILGANGVTLEYPVMRHMVNLESVYTYEGTNEMHTLVVGEALTGIAAYH